MKVTPRLFSHYTLAFFVGMVPAIESECWPFSHRNGGLFPVGMLAGFNRNTQLAARSIPPSGQCCTPGCVNRSLLGIGLYRLYATASPQHFGSAHQKYVRSTNGSWTWFCRLHVPWTSIDSPYVGGVHENRPERGSKGKRVQLLAGQYTIHLRAFRVQLADFHSL